MKKAFLSYSRKDHYFAELAVLKMQDHQIDLWRDGAKIRAGDEWKKAIDDEISKSEVIVVAVSENSYSSEYVTYEWAYALGKSIPVIPVKLDECGMHARLRDLHYLDFTNRSESDWNDLAAHINSIETGENDLAIEQSKQDPDVGQILSYLDRRGYRMVSFERLREKTDLDLTDAQFETLVKQNSEVLRMARLKGKKTGDPSRPGLAKLIP